VKVMVVCSGGGHWVQARRVAPALEGAEQVWVTVSPIYRKEIEGHRFRVVADVTRWNKVKWVVTAFQLLFILLRERPDVVLTTGALPGYFAVRIARLLGARTIWLDSIANVERLSMAGEYAGRHVDLWLTQWPHLAREGGPRYLGRVF